MKQYTVGELSRKAGVSTHVLRHYDKIGLMKPSAVSKSGYRLYTDTDLERIQRIAALRWLDLSLQDIQAVMQTERTSEISSALRLQREKFLEEIERLQQIIRAIDKLEQQETFQWQQLKDLIRLSRIQSEYANRQLHDKRAVLHQHSTNRERWHTFLFRMMKIRSGQRILEIDARDGQLWIDNASALPPCHITQCVCKQTYAGCIQAAMDQCEWQHPIRYDFAIVPLDTFWLPERSYDIIVANHLYMRIEELDTVFKTCARALKPGGRLLCAAVGEGHMSELIDLARRYDGDIHFDRMDTLNKFGIASGTERLAPYFRQVQWYNHPDQIVTDNPQLITNYLLSNYSNAQDLLKNKLEDFYGYVSKQIEAEGPLLIHKEHGVFCASSPVWHDPSLCSG